ncbi:MAG: NAD(P)H-hydrate dehydratase [Endomicrobium sp.]|jgi:NAD(P)H-hydrate epimerase|nr:NAD(P)H-hydrate dehydratase [Endomicrobium sp.]
MNNFFSHLIRNTNINKYDFGHVLVIAGSKFMPGAGILSCLGAMRAGAGIVTYAIKKENFQYISTMTLNPEIIFFIYENTSDILDYIINRRVLSIVIGPGLEISKKNYMIINDIIKTVNMPVILDASGIACFNGLVANLKNKKIKAKLILTPHMMELAKLLNIEISYIKSNRKKILCEFTKGNSLICLLKGHHTLISQYGKISTNNSGTSAMATAGSGDVLSGIISAFVNYNSNIFLATIMAVFIHGLAGELAEKDKGPISVIASDIIDNICYAIKQLINRK